MGPGSHGLFVEEREEGGTCARRGGGGGTRIAVVLFSPKACEFFSAVHQIIMLCSQILERASCVPLRSAYSHSIPVKAVQDILEARCYNSFILSTF